MRELRFAVIGWGYWGPKIARNLEGLPHGTLAMVADMDKDRIAKLNLERPWIETTTQPDKVFQAPDVDAVVIATPVRTHYALARAALLAGKHVLVEKPLTADVASCEELIALARQHDRILMVGHTFEYSPPVEQLRNQIQAGDLGDIYSIDTERLNLGLFRGDIDVIWDLAPHDVSILLRLLGQMPISVTAHAHAHLRPEIYDDAHLDLRFAGGITAHIHVSWLHPCKIRRVTIVGNRRMAVYDDTNPAEMLKIFNKGADVGADPVVSYRFGEITIPHIEWLEPLRLEVEDFANAIRTGSAPRASGESGLAVVKVLAAAQASLRHAPVPELELAPLS
jgi:predicted dehydrogenase